MEDEEFPGADPVVIARAMQLARDTDDLTAFLALGGTMKEWQADD